MPYRNDPLEAEITCHCCGEPIPAGATNWGWTWGSDGVFPDGASSMYACWNCREHWQDWNREAVEIGSDCSTGLKLELSN